MADGFKLLNGGKTRNAEVPTGGTALQSLPMDGQGSPLFMLDGSVYTVGQSRGVLKAGREVHDAKLGRMSPDGTRRNGNAQLLFYDMTEATLTVPDPQKWSNIGGGLNPAITVTVGSHFNSSSLTTGSLVYISTRSFPVTGRSTLVFRTRVRHVPPSLGVNWALESGFGNPTNSQTVTAANGAHWRRDTHGDYVPVVVINTIEILGKAVPQAVVQAALEDASKPAAALFQPFGVGTLANAPSYFFMEVALEESRAHFRLITQAGVLIAAQTIDFGLAYKLSTGDLFGNFAATHLRVFHRMWPPAQQGPTPIGEFWFAQTTVWLADRTGPDYPASQALLGYGSVMSPGGGDININTQIANYTNNTGPSTGTVSNTTRAYTQYGGQWSTSQLTGAETDFLWFALQFTTYEFVCTRISISAWNQGAAASQQAIQWGLGFNSSAPALPTAGANPYMRKAIGMHSWVSGAVSGQSGGPDVVWEGRETIHAGQYLAIIMKLFLGPGTGSFTGRGTINIDGYFE